MKIIVIVLTIYLISFVTQTNDMSAQFTGYGNDQVFQTLLPVYDIDTIPPDRPDMSYQTLLSYMFLDTIAQNNDKDFLKRLLKDCSTDYLKYLVSVVHNIKGYDEQLFRSYVIKTSDLTLSEGKYKSYPTSFINNIIITVLTERYYEVGWEKVFIAFMPYVFHVKIDSVNIGIDTTFGLGPNSFISVVASATILDIIKGRELCNCKVNNGAGIDNYINDTARKDCINFGYIKNYWTNMGFINPMPKGTRIKTVSKGEEYILFLRGNFINEREFMINPDYYYDETGGLFEIVDGKVRDNYNYWGLGHEVDLSNFIQYLKNINNEITKWFDIIYGAPKNFSEFISAFPNPFSETTTISYNLPQADRVTITIFDALGNEIAVPVNEYVPAGEHKEQFNGTHLQSGIYYYSIRIGSETRTGKMILVK